ncbi:Hint domain-containing protein [Marimonas sp. MJW-29]|uniref:Hint domain-containing protein n=1 Tax=Sulfitobacter sediminis TaxID=3234186 RepID=A0ABV3RR45_9RHOB
MDGLIISEILADNAGASAIDTDGDGWSNKADEFIEIQNTTNSTISLDGYEIWSQKGGLLYSFGSGDTIAAGGTATVVGEYTGTPPAGYYESTTNNNINWLPDGEGQKFDSIFLVNSNTGEYVVLSYGAPPRTPVLPAGFPGTTRIGAGETIDSSAPNGTAFVRDINGDMVEGTPSPGTPGVPCFCAGTLIDTDLGAVPVQFLRPGARLLTLDDGVSTLLGIRRFEISPAAQAHDPSLLPLRLPRGLCGASMPLELSPNHRVLVRSFQANLLFESAEVLIAAKLLAGFGAMQLDPTSRPLVYFHLLLGRHAVLRAHGIWAESLFLGDMVRAHYKNMVAWDLLPGVSLADLGHAETARLVLRAYEARLLLGLIAPPDARRVWHLAA